MTVFTGAKIPLKIEAHDLIAHGVLASENGSHPNEFGRHPHVKLISCFPYLELLKDSDSGFGNKKVHDILPKEIDP